MLRFSLFSFPITVQWPFWIMVLLLGGNRLDTRGPREFQLLLIWVVAVFISFIIHELGHAFMQRHYGARSRIMLYAFGGLAIADRSFPRGPSIVVSLAGPLLEIVIGFLVREVWMHTRDGAWWMSAFLFDFSWICIFWGVFNLVPIYPLDGGNVLLNVLGPAHRRTTYLVGTVCAAGLAAYALIAWGSVWNAVFFGVLAWANFQRSQGQQPPDIFRPQ